MEISPVIIIGILLSLIVNSVFFEKKTSFDIYYTTMDGGATLQGRMNLTVNSDYISAKTIEGYIAEELDGYKDISDIDTRLKIIVTSQFKTGVKWTLKDWVRKIYT